MSKEGTLSFLKQNWRIRSWNIDWYLLNLSRPMEIPLKSLGCGNWNTIVQLTYIDPSKHDLELWWGQLTQKPQEDLHFSKRTTTLFWESKEWLTLIHKFHRYSGQKASGSVPSWSRDTVVKVLHVGFPKATQWGIFRAFFWTDRPWLRVV